MPSALHKRNRRLATGAVGNRHVTAFAGAWSGPNKATLYVVPRHLSLPIHQPLLRYTPSPLTIADLLERRSQHSPHHLHLSLDRALQYRMPMAWVFFVPHILHRTQRGYVKCHSERNQRDQRRRSSRQPKRSVNLSQRKSQVLVQRHHASTSANSLLSSPSATTLPSNRWICRSACAANRGSCVTMQIVAPS